jgi:hypothetical protein
MTIDFGGRRKDEIRKEGNVDRLRTPFIDKDRSGQKERKIVRNPQNIFVIVYFLQIESETCHFAWLE